MIWFFLGLGNDVINFDTAEDRQTGSDNILSCSANSFLLGDKGEVKTIKKTVTETLFFAQFVMMSRTHRDACTMEETAVCLISIKVFAWSACAKWKVFSCKYRDSRY